MEISPEQPANHSDAHFAIRRNRCGRLIVDIVDVDVSARIVEEESEDDGTIVYTDIDPEVEEKLYVERDIDEEPSEIETYKLGSEEQ